MADFKSLIDKITKSVNEFNKGIPSIQKQMLDEVLLLTKQLNVKGDKIKITGGNIVLLARIKSKLEKIILSEDYVNAVKTYKGAFNDVVKLQNEYFSAIEEKFKPPKLAKEIRNQAIEGVLDSLTETGISANVTNNIYDMMRKAVASGGSYSTLNSQLQDYITNSQSGEGQLSKYTKQISTDALNQFSGQYSQIISADLGFEWYRYSGSNIETTRPFCLACRDRQWFHISELPKILKGDFPEFKDYDGKINRKSGLPAGMIPGTDISNFMINRGGYNCGHQWRPGSEDIVPQTVKDRVYATSEYQSWTKINGVKPKKISSDQ